MNILTVKAFQNYLKIAQSLRIQEEYYTEITHDYQRIRSDVKTYLKRYNNIRNTYKRGRQQFKRSIKLLTDNGHNIANALNCKGMREHFINALGSVCYSKFSTYNIFYVGWLLISCGFLLFMLSLVKLLDVVGHSAKGGEGLGYELGGL